MRTFPHILLRSLLKNVIEITNHPYRKLREVHHSLISNKLLVCGAGVAFSFKQNQPEKNRSSIRIVLYTHPVSVIIFPAKWSTKHHAPLLLLHWCHSIYRVGRKERHTKKEIYYGWIVGDMTPLIRETPV